ncbi:MAG: peptidylprolyl isomerase [Synechocystis sp.]|nr:peptidylprolyl isomerase [Synechocystis sp.]
MQIMRQSLRMVAQRLSQFGVMSGLALLLTFVWTTPTWAMDLTSPLLIGALAQGNAITDPNAILRYALPIDNEAVRQLQDSLEDISNHIRAKRWPAIKKDVRSANLTLTLKEDKILAGVPEDRQDQAQTLLTQIKTDLGDLETAVEAKDKAQVITVRQSALTAIGDLEGLMVTDFPFDVPAEYADLPQLKGRATVVMETNQGPLTIVVDGYSAPINAGNFVDLVQRKFYDGLPFIRSEDFFVTQAGDPDGPEVGFIDPKTKAYRAIPLEIKVKEDEAPIYGMTLEDAGLYLPELALPFNAYGAIALARPEMEPNGGSSQFFFFKFDTELTPPGFNLMDGRYSVFGYVVDGKETLNKLSEGDKILSAKVVEGAENLVNG